MLRPLWVLYTLLFFDKSDKRTIYNMIYRDGKSGPSYIKRFNVSGVTRDKPYDLTNGTRDLNSVLPVILTEKLSYFRFIATGRKY
jgi:hypothetical protein